MTRGPADKASSSTFALRLSGLALVIGLVVTRAAVSAGSSGCAEPGWAVERDPICHELARTLGQRAGLLAAVATVVVVLTMVGLSRLQAPGLPTRAGRRANP